MGFEIADTTGLGEDLKGQMVVLLEAGSNPITAEEWETYVPPPGYVLNTPRQAWFNELIVLGSPYVPTGEITMVTTTDGYTWESVAAVQRSIYPYIPISVDSTILSPQEIAYSITTPPPGIVLVDSNDKNHDNVYYGTEGPNASLARMNYYIQDLWGNTYILKSLNAVNSTPELVEQAVADAVLPLGWTKLAGSYFSEDVTFSPSYSGDGNSIAHANEFRDSADSAWMQIEWGSLGMTLNAAAEGGLPIWAGPKGGLLLGTHNDDNLYGAQGHDLLYAGAGNDALDGGQGLNHAIFVGDQSQYEVIRISDDTVQIADQIQDRDGTDSLTRVQRVDFADYSVGFDVQAGQSTGVAYRMYGVLDRAPDLEGLGYWIADFDNGLGLIGMAQSFLDSKEYVQAHENGLTDDQFLTQLYEDVLKRNPDEAGNEYWLQQLANGASRASVLVGFTESNESIELYAGQLDNGASYVGWWI
jgi:serralysin